MLPLQGKAREGHGGLAEYGREDCVILFQHDPKPWVPFMSSVPLAYGCAHSRYLRNTDVSDAYCPFLIYEEQSGLAYGGSTYVPQAAEPKAPCLWGCFLHEGEVPSDRRWRGGPVCAVSPVAAGRDVGLCALCHMLSEREGSAGRVAWLRVPVPVCSLTAQGAGARMATSPVPAAGDARCEVMTSSSSRERVPLKVAW